MNPLYALASHAAGDFPLQTKGMADEKLENPWVRGIHVATYTAAYLPALATASWNRRQIVTFLATIALTHFGIDSRRWNDEAPLWFDQALHIVALALANALAESVPGGRDE